MITEAWEYILKGIKEAVATSDEQALKGYREIFSGLKEPAPKKKSVRTNFGPGELTAADSILFDAHDHETTKDTDPVIRPRISPLPKDPGAQSDLAEGEITILFLKKT